MPSVAPISGQSSKVESYIAPETEMRELFATASTQNLVFLAGFLPLRAYFRIAAPGRKNQIWLRLRHAVTFVAFCEVLRLTALEAYLTSISYPSPTSQTYATIPPMNCRPLALLLFTLAPWLSLAQDQPPKAPVHEVQDDYFGTKITDPYRWLENIKQDPEAQKWLKAQADFTREKLDSMPGYNNLKPGLPSW